jgi:hypothetical protein
MTDPNGFVVLTTEDNFVGIWRAHETAERVLNRSPSAKGERIVEYAPAAQVEMWREQAAVSYKDASGWRVRCLEAEKERGELRQRVQQAEKAARTTIEDCRRQGMSLGRALANYGAKMEAERAARLLHVLRNIVEFHDSDEWEGRVPEEFWLDARAAINEVTS